MEKNRITLAGYLGATPAARTLPSGTAVVDARLAESSYRYVDHEGRPQRRTNWHSLVFYGKSADIALRFERGDNIEVDGVLQSRFITVDSKPRTIWQIVVQSAHRIAPLNAEGRAPAPAAPENPPESVDESDWP